MKNTDYENTTIEIFNEFALKTKRQIYSSENQYQVTKWRQYSMTKRTLYIPAAGGEQVFIIGYHNPKAFNENQLFFGAFFPIAISSEKKLHIRKRYFFDNINPFKKGILKSNNETFDLQTIMKGNDINIAKDYLRDYSVQTTILDSLNLADGINVGFNCVDIEFVPEFRDKSNFGIFTRSKWIFDFDLLEDLLTKTGRIHAAFLKINRNQY